MDKRIREQVDLAVKLSRESGGSFHRAWSEAERLIKARNEREFRKWYRRQPARKRRWVDEWERLWDDKQRSEVRRIRALKRRIKQDDGAPYEAIRARQQAIKDGPRPYCSLASFLATKEHAWWRRKYRQLRHGSNSCYVNDGCRCRRCKRAHADRARQRRVRA